jgi:hypothetical protein
MSFRSSAQTEDFDLLARMDVRYMLGSRVNQARSRVICRHSARPEDISALPSIVLQKSKIDRLQKFRESRFLDFSSAARLRTARTKVCSRSFDKRCGPFTSLRTKRISGARKFRSSAPKDSFATVSPRKQTSEPSSVVSALDRAEAKKLPPPSMPTVRFEPIVADLNVKPWPCGMRS